MIDCVIVQFLPAIPGNFYKLLKTKPCKINDGSKMFIWKWYNFSQLNKDYYVFAAGKERLRFFIRKLLFMLAPCSLSTVLMCVADYYLLVHAFAIENLAY